MSTIREQRAQRSAAQKKKNMPKEVVQKYWKPALIILVLIGGVTAIVAYQMNKPDCPGHWHSTFQVYVDDERISYSHPAFDLSGDTPMSSHLHQPNDNMWHFEPNPKECIGFAVPLGHVDTKVSSGKLVLSGHHDSLGQAGTYTNEGNRTLQIFHAPDGENWQSISSGKLNKRQLLDGERVLILFGNYTEERIAQLQDAVPMPGQ